MISSCDKSLLPILLCHAACTGGSLIYRLLVSYYGFVGLSEVSHAWLPKSKTYLPIDPEAQLYAQGIFSQEQFAKIFYKRICCCERIVGATGKILLIREHSHQYFFSRQKDHIVMDNVSWINNAYNKERGVSLQCLLSVRDPIDSWLALRNSFPNESPFDFDEYCEKYLFFLDMAEKTNQVYLFKYEDLVSDAKVILNEIGKFIDRSPINADLEKNTDVESSGNSGRQSSSICSRPRRPFTIRLVRAAEASKNYKELCKRLEYPCLFDDVFLREKHGIIKSSLNNMLHNCTDMILKPINQLARKFPLIRD